MSISLLPLLLVAAGGALGATGRYLVGGWTAASLGTGFPWGILIVNVVGSFLIGLVIAGYASSPPGGHEWRLFLATGVLGGFTTFSAFSLDVVLMLEREAFGMALLYIGLSVVLSVAAAAAGLMLMRGIV